MQDLQGDLATLRMDGIGNRAMLRGFAARRKLASEWLDPAGPVGGVSPGDDKPDFTARAFAEISGQTIVLIAVFEPRVHGAHDNPVAECREAQVEWGQEVRVVGHVCSPRWP